MEQLTDAGYRNVVGADFAEKMLAACRTRLPHASLIRNDGRTLPFRDRSFDAVVLFTVLTCIPGNDDQRALLAELTRILSPGGLLYISDLLINTDARNVTRYQRCAGQFGTYGVFALPEGVIVRHHQKDWIDHLTSAFTRIEFERFTATTMNGNPSAAFQYLGRLGD